MAVISKIRVLGTNGVPKTLNLAASGTILKADNFEIGSTAVQASKPMRLDADKRITTGDITQSEVTGLTTALSNKSDINHTHTGVYEPANSNIQSHISSTSNPHSVTKEQVGLGNVDNVQQLPMSYLDTDSTLSSNSDSKVASQKAIKTYVDQKAITGGIVKEALLISEQRSDSQGILAAIATFIASNPSANDTFIIKNNSTTETWTFKSSRSDSYEVGIGTTVADTMSNLATAIATDSSVWGAVFTVDGLDSINSDGVVVIYEKTTASGASTSRVYGSISNQSYIKVVEYNGTTQYSTNKTPINLPSTDPGEGRFGFRRQISELENGEIHLDFSTDVLQSWNADASSWFDLSGSGSLPDATKVIKGKVQVGDGIAVSSGVISVDVDGSTIELTGTSPNKKISVKSDVYSLVNHNHDSSYLGINATANAANRVEIPAIAGESFDANKTYAVRYAVSGETAGRVYKASKLSPSDNKFWVQGVIQTTSGLSAGDSCTLIVIGEVTLKSGDSAFSTGSENLPIFLHDGGSFSTTPPANGLDPDTPYASVMIGSVKVRSSTVTENIMMVKSAQFFGEDIA